jgi:nucleotide-binding universal stress UspA family protein
MTDRQITDRRIIVGVDGSDGGRRALQWAVAEADRRGAVVQAVTAWRWDRPDLPPHATTTPDEERARAEQTQRREIASLGERHLATLAAEVVEGRAEDVLSMAARDADLLVLGSHGHSRIWHTVLGSVSEACIRMATCPVVVIPAEQPAPRTNAGLAVQA